MCIRDRVTCAQAIDFDKDGDMDLVLAGEWEGIRLFLNDGGQLSEKKDQTLNDNRGWWSSIEVKDIDGDGDQDIVAGNLGLNYKYKASAKEPFHIYLNDFDKNGTKDIVLGYYNEGVCYPLRGRECSSEQMPFLKEKFPTYHAFGSADLKEVYGDELNSAYHKEVNNFASGVFKNEGGSFVFQKFPNEAQLSSMNGLIVEDFDGDGKMDVLAGGNLFASEVETPRNDAGMGVYLKGTANGFEYIPIMETGFFIPGDVKDLQQIQTEGESTLILVTNNDSKMQLFEQNKSLIR